MKKLILLLILILFANCHNNNKQSQKQDSSNKQSQKQDNSYVHNSTKVDNRENDSIALLHLTQNLYEWKDGKSKGKDFVPVQDKNADSIYPGIDMALHKLRLEELQHTNLFSKDFINTYNKIAIKIDQEFKSGTLVWNIGELPPFGSGADPWCNCQDVPDDFLNKIWIMHLIIKDNVASYNWSWGDGIVYNIKAKREDSVWKILYMEGFDYQSFINSFEKNNDFTGKWENGLVTLSIGETSLAFLYHGQCVYFYPIRKINDTEFEMIWARDMDCKFDNGTDNTFGLKDVPKIGKPFSKIILKNKILYVQYYYKEWVEKYKEQVQDDVFTSEYLRKKDAF
jgi:hypothetical protein